MASVGGASIDDGMDNVELTQSQDTGYRRYRDLPHRSFNETLKTHSSFAVKLSETGESSLFVYETPFVLWLQRGLFHYFFLATQLWLAGWLAVACPLHCAVLQYSTELISLCMYLRLHKHSRL